MNTKSKLFTLVVEEFDNANQRHILASELIKYLQKEDYIVYYAMILHDRDVDENGELKRKHFHIVIQTRTPYAKSTILTDIVKEVIVARECVSVRAYDNIKLAVQYLIHKNDVDKEQYDIMGIISSDETATIDYIEKDIDTSDLEIGDLISICGECDSLTQVYTKVGIVNARKYRWIIQDIMTKKENDEICTLRKTIRELSQQLKNGGQL